MDYGLIFVYVVTAVIVGWLVAEILQAPKVRNLLFLFVTSIPSAHAGHKHIVFESADELALAMKSASEAHHIYEASLGHPDENWMGWYALHMVEAQQPPVGTWQKRGVKPASSVGTYQAGYWLRKGGN